jgi:hypothetical protein
MPNVSAIDRLSTNRIVLERLGDGDPRLPADTIDERLLRRVLPARAALPPLAGGLPGKRTGSAGINFAILAPESGAMIGFTQLLEFNRSDLRAALGPCWASVQGLDSAIVSHTAFLLLQLGFETLGCRRLDLGADARDRAAPKMLRRLGFTCEGVLRSFESGPDGKARDIAVWSVILPERRRVKIELQAALANEDWPWKDRLPAILPP